jgi:hypothetical protein
MRSKSPNIVARLLALWLGAPIAMGLAAAPCHAQVTVMPPAILFDGEPGTKAITVTNTGPRERIYRISLLNLLMQPDGNMIAAGEPQEGEHFAGEELRFSPREVVLAPGKSEVVRFHVVSPRPGEYRTHVLVQQVPEVGALDKPPFQRENGVTVDLQAVYGVAIPLIIRQGELPVSLRFAEAQIAQMPDGAPAVALKLERGGARSLRGSLSLRLAGKEIAFYDGVSFYAPATERDLLLPVTVDDVSALRQGRLVARFAEPDDVKGAVTVECPIELH